MLPDPLHPAVVHLPMALAVLLPLAAAGLVLAIGRQLLPARAWAFVVVLQLLLAGSAWLAIETGEHEEERVEEVVAERLIESHEEAAERFAILAGVALLVVGAGLAPASLGRFARIASVAATAGVLAAGVAVGHSGGELVYRHGAANAYVQAGAHAGASGSSRHERSEHDDDEDDD